MRAFRKEWGVTPVVKQIDTLGGEYPASTNYLYMTYNGRTDDVAFDDRGADVVDSVGGLEQMQLVHQRH